MEVSGQLHAPATLLLLPPPSIPRTPIEEKAGWALELVWTFWTKEKPLPLQGFKTQIGQCIAQSLC